jgi:N-acetylglutamate synthase-like GNAT family acetyltransferase
VTKAKQSITPDLMPASDGIIRPATLSDWSYIEHLTNHFSYELGFIPRVAFLNRIEGRRGGGVLMNVVNKQEGGFLHFGSMRRDECRIFQAAIDYDLQRQHHGLALVKRFVQIADEAGVRLITCRCLVGLNAQHFWKSAGFEHVGVEQVARGLLWVWAKRLHLIDDLLAGRQPPLLPMRQSHCRGCGNDCTYTRGPKGQLWKLCAACTRERVRSAC